MVLDHIRAVTRKEYQIQVREYNQGKNVLSKVKKLNSLKTKTNKN